MGTVSNSVSKTEVDINQSKWYVQSMLALYSCMHVADMLADSNSVLPGQVSTVEDCVTPQVIKYVSAPVSQVCQCSSSSCGSPTYWTGRGEVGGGRGEGRGEGRGGAMNTAGTCTY